jgi:hypothetical protein
MKLLFENWRKYLAEGGKQAKIDALKADKEKFINSLEQKLVSITDFDKLFQELEIMPMGKQGHSARVGGYVSGATKDPDAIIGALMHDYVERHPDGPAAIEALFDKGLISKDAKDIVIFLSSTDEDVAKYAGDNEPLHHIQQVFTTIDNVGLKTKLAMIKAGDRVDNLNRRVWDPSRKGPLTSKKGIKYLKKSADLFNFLLKHSKGPDVGAVIQALEPEAQTLLAKVDPSMAGFFERRGQSIASQDKRGYRE